MAFAPSSSLTVDNEGLCRLVVTWYRKLADQTIEREAEVAIKEAVRRYVLEDEEFRRTITEAITKAAQAMPLDAIADAVKQAIGDMRTNGRQ